MRPMTDWPLRPVPFAWWTILPGALLAGIAPMMLAPLPLPPEMLAPLQFVLMAGLALILIRLGSGRLDRQVTGLTPVPALRGLLVGAGGLAALYGGLWLIGLTKAPGADAAQQQAVAGMLAFGQDVRADLSMILITVILAPVAEELAYRGLVFRGLRDGLAAGGFLNRRAGGWPMLPGWLVLALAVGVSAYAFISIHGGEGQDGLVLEYLLFAAVMALSYHLSGCLLVPVMLHAIMNSVTIIETVWSPYGSALAADWLMALVWAGPFIAALLSILLGAALPAGQDEEGAKPGA